MLSEPARAERLAADDAQRSLLAASVGPHRLVFDLRTLLAIERGTTRVAHEGIRGPVDLRPWFGLPASDDLGGDSVLVPGGDAVYRLVVDELSNLIQSDLRQVFPLPRVLAPLTRRLCLRGAVVLEDGLAFLVDPGPLAEQAWTAQEAGA